jgi:hypothetical protein
LQQLFSTHLEELDPINFDAIIALGSIMSAEVDPFTASNLSVLVPFGFAEQNFVVAEYQLAIEPS